MAAGRALNRTTREIEYRASLCLVCYSTLLRRLGVLRPTFHVVPPGALV